MSIINNVQKSFPLNVIGLFNYSIEATNAIELLAKELTELYNFIEPGLFERKIIVIKNICDTPALPLDRGTSLKMNKAKLFGYDKDIVIQLFDNRDIILWEDEDYFPAFQSGDNIIYVYETNSEKIFAKKKEIDITINSFGSQFSDEFDELQKQIVNYHLYKIKYSSCPIFHNSWNSNKRIFFKGGGKDIPEKYMQESLHNFIKDLNIFKGKIGQFDPTREHNLNASKPVDIIVRWEKSNRIALIEVKWLGKSIYDGRFKSTYSNARANEGFVQLKEYYDLAKKDNPNKIIRCYLIVIDARRWHTNEQTSAISRTNGMYYEHKEIELDEDKKYHLVYKDIHKPIRMFVEPICD